MADNNMADDDDLLNMEFEKGEEVDPKDIRAGEWYIWENVKFGYRSPQVFRAEQSGSTAPYMPSLLAPAVKYGGNGQYPKSAVLPIAACHDAARRSSFYSQGYSSRLWRTKQQPKITWQYWQSNIQAATIGVNHPNTGTDPEIFAEDAAGNVIPAWEFLPSKKDKRFATPPTRFWDGFQAEFTVSHGACQDGVADRILLGLQAIQSALPSDAKLSTKSVVDIPPGLMRSASSEHIDFGCRPSLNAYGLAGEVVADPRSLPIRFAGGHIHWGDMGQYSEAQWAEAVKFVDLVAGLISVSISEGLDDPRRRRYYGLAGEFRLPPHGIEYRTLSNSWLLYPAIYHLLFTTGRLALRLGLAGHRTEFSKVPEAAVVSAINNSDHEMARRLIQDDRDLFMAIFNQYWSAEAKRTFEKVLTPITSWGIELDRIVDNWAATGASGYRQRWCDFLTHGPVKLGAKWDAKSKSATKSPALPDMLWGAEPVRPTQPRA